MGLVPEVGLHEHREVHQLGDRPGLQVHLHHHVLDGLAVQLVHQGNDLPGWPANDVVVELVARQVIDPLDPAQAVQPGQPGGGDAGDHVPVHPQDAVQAVALQHHLIAEDPLIVEEEAVAQIAVGPHHGKEALGEGRPALPVGVVQAGGVAGAGLRHGDGEGHLLPDVPPGAADDHGDLVGLPRHQADELELVGPAVRLSALVRGRGGKVGQTLHMDGIGHLGLQVGLKIEVEAVVAGAIGVQDGQRRPGLPGLSPGLGLLQGLGQPVLDGGIVVSKALLIHLEGDQLEHGQVGLHIGVPQLQPQLLVLAQKLAHVHPPGGAHRALLTDKIFGPREYSDQHRQNHKDQGRQDQQEPPSLCVHATHSFSRLPGPDLVPPIIQDFAPFCTPFFLPFPPAGPLPALLSAPRDILHKVFPCHRALFGFLPH